MLSLSSKIFLSQWHWFFSQVELDSRMSLSSSCPKNKMIPDVFRFWVSQQLLTLPSSCIFLPDALNTYFSLHFLLWNLPLSTHALPLTMPSYSSLPSQLFLDRNRKPTCNSVSILLSFEYLTEMQTHFKILCWQHEKLVNKYGHINSPRYRTVKGQCIFSLIQSWLCTVFQQFVIEKIIQCQYKIFFKGILWSFINWKYSLELNVLCDKM